MSSVTHIPGKKERFFDFFFTGIKKNHRTSVFIFESTSNNFHLEPLPRELLAGRKTL